MASKNPAPELFDDGTGEPDAKRGSPDSIAEEPGFPRNTTGDLAFPWTTKEEEDLDFMKTKTWSCCNPGRDSPDQVLPTITQKVEHAGAVYKVAMVMDQRYLYVVKKDMEAGTLWRCRREVVCRAVTEFHVEICPDTHAPYAFIKTDDRRISTYWLTEHLPFRE